MAKNNKNKNDLKAIKEELKEDHITNAIIMLSSSIILKLTLNLDTKDLKCELVDGDTILSSNTTLK